MFFFFFQAEDGIRDYKVTGVQTCALPILAVEILVSLYFYNMRHDPKQPAWPDRDRFVLSKGHAAPVLFATLAEAGYFPVSELKTLRKLNSRLQGHPDHRVPGVEFPGGSLGIGLSAAIGMALAGKIDKKDYRVYALLGDGELDEGETWEAAMAAPKFKLGNLTAIIDRTVSGSISLLADGIDSISDAVVSF